MTDTELNTLRKQLWANGYFPVPNLSKKCVLPGWNGQGFYARELKRYKGDVNAMLDSWSIRHKRFQATGVRMEKGLGAIDGDVDDEGLMSILVGILKQVVPEVETRAPLRFGSGTHKATWFVRVEGEQWTVLKTHEYIRSDELEAWQAAVTEWRAAGANKADRPKTPKYHHVEIFGDSPDKKGACHRQCGVFGWNAEPGNKEGKPVAVYSWADYSLLDVPLKDLPVLTMAQAYEITKQFEETAKAAGWAAKPPDENIGVGGEVFDIDREKTVFSTEAHGEVKYAELEALVQMHGEVRCNPSFAGVISESDDRCNATWHHKHNCVGVHEFGAAANHYPSDVQSGEPKDLKAVAEAMERIKEKVKQAPPKAEAADDDDGGGRADEPPPPPAAQTSVGGLLTQDLVALVVAERGEGGMRYCHDTGGWFMWDGTYWKTDRLKWGFHTCREVSRLMSKQEKEKKAIRAMRSAGFFSSVERIAATDPRLAVASGHWDQDPFLMGTPDGTLDLKTGTLRKADPADGITKLAALSPREMETPLWDKFLKQTFKGDEKLIEFNQRWFGYCLTGDIREQSLWFGSGSGGNGKGVMLNTITWLMGDYAKAAPMDMFTAKAFDGHPTDLAMLRGARLVTASETEEGRAWAESRIKQLTGGDPVTARFMRENFFTYTPQFKISLIGNHNPRLKNVDDAARRRFKLVPFLNKVTEAAKDTQLEQKLRAEGPGIMQWLVDGCLAWKSGGLQVARAVEQATKRYFDEQDVIGQWIEEYCEKKSNVETLTLDLFRSWSLYAQTAGVEPKLQKDLTEALDRRGYQPVRKNTGRYIRGLCIAQKKTEKTMPKPDLKSV